MAAYYNENNKYCARWLANLIREGLICSGVVDDRPIQEVTEKDLTPFLQCHFFAGIGGWSYALRLAGWPDNLRVWTGSCPCQPFSIAGNQLGTKDKRHLWPEFNRLIKKCKPPTIFGEQVTGQSAYKWFSRVRSDLELSGYSVGAANLCAFSSGAAHRRQRLYFVAYPGAKGLPEWSNTKTIIKAKAIHKRNGLTIFFEKVVPTYKWDNQPVLGKGVYGIPFRMEQVCAYGNAIVPQVAAQFIKAAM